MNGIQRFATLRKNAILRNALPFSHLRGSEGEKNAEKSSEKCERQIAPSRFARWMKFNFVGGIGMIVQFVALFLLKSALHINYLAATAIAVEIAVLHNFVWHEKFTWAEKMWVDKIWAEKLWVDRIQVDRGPVDRLQNSHSGPLRRLARFHVANGVVSILGNLALMRAMVGAAHMNYLMANAIAIAVCAVANFAASEWWVFGR
jgi:putative flippase GtrA